MRPHSVFGITGMSFDTAKQAKKYQFRNLKKFFQLFWRLSIFRSIESGPKVYKNSSKKFYDVKQPYKYIWCKY